MKFFANCNVSFFHNNTEYKIFNETSYLDGALKYTFTVSYFYSMTDIHEVTTLHNFTKPDRKKDKIKRMKNLLKILQQLLIIEFIQIIIFEK